MAEEPPGKAATPSRPPVQVGAVEVLAIQGPVPPPALLEGYERVLPGSAERVFRMAEREQAHRHNVEMQLSVVAKRGQVFAFILGLVGIGGGILLAYVGKSLTGFGTFFCSLATLVGVYLYGRRRPEPTVTKDSRSEYPPSTQT